MNNITMFPLNFLDAFQITNWLMLKLRLPPAGRARVQLGDKLISKRKIKDNNATYKQGNVNAHGHVNKSALSKSSENKWIQASTKQKKKKALGAPLK